jgi:hypothetical protein
MTRSSVSARTRIARLWAAAMIGLVVIATPAQAEHRGRAVHLDGGRSSARTRAFDEPPNDEPPVVVATIGDTTVRVPSGWPYQVSSDGLVLELSKEQYFARLQLFPSDQRDPDALLGQIADAWLTEVSGTSDLDTSDVNHWKNVPGAWRKYAALHTDDSGSIGIAGEIDALVRNDGAGLGILLQQSGATKEAAADSYYIPEFQDLNDFAVSSFYA